MEYYFKALRHYADFSGRASRKEYWMFFLFYAVSVFAVALVGVLIGTTINKYVPQAYATLLLMMYIFAVTVPFLAISVRRLHDSGKSGWWMLLALFQVLNSIVRNMRDVENGLKIFVAILAIAAGICILIFMLLPGIKGKNRYGANPDNITAYGKRVFEKSTGLALVIAMAVIFAVAVLIPLLKFYAPLNNFFNPYFLINNLGIFLIIAAGILLLLKKDRTKEVGILLSSAAVISLILLILSYILSGSNISDEIRTVYMLNSVLNLLTDVALLMAGTVLIQQGIKRQIININAQTAAIALIIVQSLVIVRIVYNFMTDTNLLVADMFNILEPVAFLVLARYLLLPHDTLPSETIVTDDADTDMKMPVHTQTENVPHGKMHFIFAIINIVVGVIFLFSSVIVLVQRSADAIVGCILLMISLFMWIVGFVYLVKRYSCSQAIRILNIIAAVISLILMIFVLIGIIVEVAH
ncbi:MAG: DUF805 domain-containing protein [Prevotellaceae bacterium]|jgi:uncharacterized membrane protein YhaH (DUF805 family)|nr:DUF805 domain-containing protein [Prevotellaceae bacterium]